MEFAAARADTSARRRGRPRRAEADGEILRATIELLTEGGQSAASIDAIAARSGVAKSTIYRRWDSRDELILDAIRSAVHGTAAHARSVAAEDQSAGSPIRGAAHNMVDLATDPVFRAAFPTIARELMTPGSVVADRFRAEVARPIREAMKERLRLEAERGVIRADVDADLLFDIVNGALLYRAILGQPVTHEIADRIADLVIAAASPVTS